MAGSLVTDGVLRDNGHGRDLPAPRGKLSNLGYPRATILAKQKIQHAMEHDPASLFEVMRESVAPDPRCVVASYRIVDTRDSSTMRRFKS